MEREFWHGTEEQAETNQANVSAWDIARMRLLATEMNLSDVRDLSPRRAVASVDTITR